MTLIKVNPNGLRPRFATPTFDRFFNDFFAAPPRPATNGVTNKFPAVNVVETDELYRLELAVPGLTKEDISIQVKEEVLHLEANKTVEPVEGETFRTKTFGNYNFKRQYRLADTIDTAGITATVEQGVLTVTLPKKEEAKPEGPRTIEIS